MKKLLLLLLLPLSLLAQQQTVETTDNLNEGRVKINANFTELYTALDATSPISVTAATSLDATAFGKIHILTGTISDYTVDLPTAVGNAGRSLILKGAAALTKVVTIQGVSGHTIDGESDRKISSEGSFTLFSDGANWIVLNEVGSWIPYTPVLTGFSSDPTITRCAYFRVGKICQVSFVTATAGVSNATTKTITVPFNSDVAAASGITTANINSGTIATTGGLIATRAGSNTVDIYRDLAAAAWTASGNCRFSFNITYRMQ